MDGHSYIITLSAGPAVATDAALYIMTLVRGVATKLVVDQQNVLLQGTGCHKGNCWGRRLRDHGVRQVIILHFVHSGKANVTRCLAKNESEKNTGCSRSLAAALLR